MSTGSAEIITGMFPGRAGLQQRVVPEYRAPFFDSLAAACQRGLSVFAGEPLAQEAIAVAGEFKAAQRQRGRNYQISQPASAFYLCWQAGLLRWLETWQPDALIVEANPRYASTRLAVRWMHARGRPVIGWGLGTPPIRPAGLLNRLRRWERYSFLHSLDGLIAYSRRGADEYRALGFPSKPVWVAPNAAASRPAARPPEKPAGYRGRPTVLFVGRLQARKRVDLLLSACSRLPANLQPRLVVVGDGPARQEWISLAQSIYPGAEFPGARRGIELEPYYREADLFVLPGTGGLAIQQAMAHGLPVIVAQGDGTQDDLIRSSNGLQVPPDDLPALVGALESTLSDVGRMRQMGNESYRIVAEEINLENMVRVFVEALCQVSGNLSPAVSRL